MIRLVAISAREKHCSARLIAAQKTHGAGMRNEITGARLIITYIFLTSFVCATPWCIMGDGSTSRHDPRTLPTRCAFIVIFICEHLGDIFFW